MKTGGQGRPFSLPQRTPEVPSSHCATTATPQPPTAVLNRSTRRSAPLREALVHGFTF